MISDWHTSVFSCVSESGYTVYFGLELLRVAVRCWCPGLLTRCGPGWCRQRAVCLLPGGVVFVWVEHARVKLDELPKEKHFANQILFSAGFASQHNGSFSWACAVISISCSGPALPRLGEYDLMGWLCGSEGDIYTNRFQNDFSVLWKKCGGGRQQLGNHCSVRRTTYFYHVLWCWENLFLYFLYWC